MPDHERCAGCGANGRPDTSPGVAGPYIACMFGRCWMGPIAESVDDAWEQWDCVMRAARETRERESRLPDLPQE